MRSFILPLVLTALLAAVMATTAQPGESDEIGWIRADGSPGWSTVVPRETKPDGVSASPLMAPTWFSKLPAGKVPLASSGTFEFASARGKVLVIDFWASWCGPCIMELPHIQKLHATRSDKGLVVLAVNVDEDAAAAMASAKHLGLTMTIGLNDLAVYRALGVHVLPTVVVVDRQGRVRGRWSGYTAGFEKELGTLVDGLLADNLPDAGRLVADVLVGSKRLKPLWARDVPGSADGVTGLPAGSADGVRVVSSTAGMLLSLGADGQTVTQRNSPGCAGRLLDFGIAANGSREIVGFRVGAVAVGVVALQSGSERAIDATAPIVDVAVETEAGGDRRHLAVVTTNGAMLAGANDDHAAPLDGAGAVRSVASRPGRGVLALRADGSLSWLGAASASWPVKAEGAARLLAARDEGAAVGPRTAIASAYGRFLPGNGRQIAVATYAGHLVLLDAADGRLLFDAVWADLHDLSAVDLTGDGLDELLVAAGHSITALGAPAAR